MSDQKIRVWGDAYQQASAQGGHSGRLDPQIEIFPFFSMFYGFWGVLTPLKIILDPSPLHRTTGKISTPPRKFSANGPVSFTQESPFT